MKRFLALLVAVMALTTVVLVGTNGAGASQGRALRSSSGQPKAHWCNTNGVTCAEPYQNWEEFAQYHTLQQEGVQVQDYIGHDEPSVLFYSNKAGSGNDNTYNMVLPKDPPVLPTQDQSGGTFNFQLHPAFWLGMAMCDDQSAPNPDWTGAAYPNHPCTPDSDSNIYTSTTASDPNYIGKGPGVAFMEMQFYPPGWVKWPVGNSCDATRWCAALNIDSLSEDMNNGTFNNADCLNTAGLEYVNFAYLTKSGVATSAANPVNPDRFNLDPTKDFFMKSGDQLSVHMFDTASGFTVVVNDLTTGRSGKMVASAANGFASVKFDPNANSCSTITQAYHPMYSTSSPSTRVIWAAHSYNVAYSDEIGHFEYCADPIADNALSCGGAPGSGFATSNDPSTAETQDMNYCLPVPGLGDPNPTASSRIKVGGCLGVLDESDIDFDGVPYDPRAWPGGFTNNAAAELLAPSPIMFTSPTFGGGRNFGQTAFEVNLPRIEGDNFGGVTEPCQRHVANPADPNPGQGCVNPPPQSRFYPFFSTTIINQQCWWQEGGANLPNTRNRFGGEVAEFGSVQTYSYPASPAGTVTQRDNDFRQILDGNPCRA